MSKINKKIVRLTGNDLKRAATVGMGREDAKTVAGWMPKNEEDLGNKIKLKVYKKTGIKLNWEIKRIGIK